MQGGAARRTLRAEARVMRAEALRGVGVASMQSVE
jgi:hypothetical protein